MKLIGYFEEGSERILVVEFVSNGNLGEHIDGTFGKPLDMSTRLDIAIDIAHALTYLHLYADRPIIHRDIKSSNILLTDKYRAKVADFGFSRVGPSIDAGATHVSTQVKGTAGQCLCHAIQFSVTMPCLTFQFSDPSPSISYIFYNPMLHYPPREYQFA